MPSATLNRIVMDSVHGICDLDNDMRDIVDTREIQRLRQVRQTGLAYLVYPGLEHSRFTHLLGVYSIARRVFRLLQDRAEEFLGPSRLDKELEKAFLAAALCHYIGHTALSHALEPVLRPKGVRTHEDCTLNLLLDDGLELRKALRKTCDPDEVVQLLRGDHWIDGLCKLLSGPVDVDRADYLLRDTRAAGLVYGLHDLDWMIRSVYLWPDADSRQRLVFDRGRGLVALRHFLAARQSMYQQVYWHRTVRAAEQMVRVMFERAISVGSGLSARMRSRIPRGLRGVLTEGREGRPTLEEFLATDDVAVFTTINLWAELSTDPVLRWLSHQFVRRQLPKEVYSGSKGIPEEIRRLARDAVADSIQRLEPTPGLPRLNRNQADEALDCFVLGDRCPFEEDLRLEGLLFDTGARVPLSLKDLGDEAARDIGHGATGFTIVRLYVLENFEDAVRNALEKGDNKQDAPNGTQTR